MEVLIAILALGFGLVGLAALVCMIIPIRRIRLVTRLRALGVLALAFVGFIAVGFVFGEYGTHGQPSLLGWLVVLAAGFGIIRFVLAERRRPPAAARSSDKRSSKLPTADAMAKVAGLDAPPAVKAPELRPLESPRVGAAQRSASGAPATDGTGTPEADLTPPAPIRSRRVRARRAPRTGTKWIVPGSDVHVAGRNLGDMVYVGSENRRDTWEQANNALVDPGLPVAKVGTDLAGESLPYWSSYRDINSRVRATYLDWLAGGRSDPRVGPGYVFLYFYGLERRFFLDAPAEEEKRHLVAEVSRLLDAYSQNHSVRRYLGAFLNAAAVVLEPHGDRKPPFAKSAHELPLLLRVAIGQMAKSGQPLSAACVR